MLYKIFKRLVDIIVSILGLIITSPILIVTSLLIKLESKGPIIFKQDRLGRIGKTFKIYKFRSMHIGAEQTGTGQYSFASDPRVTKIGRIIRRLSIDELPQFINILKGEMSLIGPRPTLTYHPWSIDKYSDSQKERFNVRPGVTGLAQINGRKELNWEKRFEYDVEYVRHLSFFLDLKIFFVTIKKVILMENNMNTNKTVNDSENKWISFIGGVFNGFKANVYYE